MFSKVRNTTLAVAAVAAVGAAVLIASAGSADARGFGGGGFSRGGGGVSHVAVRTGGGFKGGGSFNKQPPIRTLVGHPGRPQIKLPPAWRIPPIVRVPHHPNWCRWNHRCGIHVRWHRPWIYGGVAATTYAVAPAVATVAPAPSCTCLKKEYTPDNLVVFTDVCTKEVASAPIGNTQVQLPAPQGPVQQ